jgi:integrase/recombinase XerD
MTMEDFLTDPRTLQALRQSLFGPYLDLYVRQLVAEGYAAETIRLKLRVAGAFSKWLKRKRIHIGDIRLEHVRNYIRCRVKCCRWTQSIGMKLTLTQLFAILRTEDVIRNGDSEPTRTLSDMVVDDYAVYLKHQRNLADLTIARFRKIASCFLREIFGDKRLRLEKLQGKAVLAFIQLYARRHPNEATAMATALRSFLRYLRYRNFLKGDLAAVVPPVVRWSCATLPKAITSSHAKAVLSSCDRRTAIGKRDYAILLLLARLGVRAGEVRSLKLEDIDWDSGKIIVYGKNGRVLQLPLLKSVGKAIADNLQ